MISLILPLAVACGGPAPSSGGATSNPRGSAAATAASISTAAPSPTTESATSTSAITIIPETAPAEQPTAETATVASAETTAAVDATVAATETVAGGETATTAAETTTTATAQAATEDRPAFGIVAHLYYTDRARVVQLAENAGFEWIRQQVPWKDTERPDRTFAFEELDSIVETVASKNKKLLLSIAKSPDFLTGRKDDNGMPKDPKDFGRFAEALAQRYKGKLHAIEVWNEQNLAIENGGNVTLDDVGRYVEMVKEGYTRIKAVDPSIVVVAGALSSTGENNPTRGIDDISYYKAMYTYNNGELKNYMDAQGFHPATTLNPPEKLWPDDPGPGCAMDMKSWCDHPTHYFRHIENVRKVMQDSGVGDKKIWITEIGWATQNNTPGYEYGNYISPEQQAEYLERALAMTVFKYSDFVGTVFLWNLNFAVSWEQQGNPLHEQAAFGILNGDWSPRPAFTRVQGFIVATKTSTKD